MEVIPALKGKDKTRDSNKDTLRFSHLVKTHPGKNEHINIDSNIFRIEMSIAEKIKRELIIDANTSNTSINILGSIKYIFLAISIPRTTLKYYPIN